MGMSSALRTPEIGWHERVPMFVGDTVLWEIAIHHHFFFKHGDTIPVPMFVGNTVILVIMLAITEASLSGLPPNWDLYAHEV